MRLDGKVALITGAGRNIGRAIATTFAREGARLAIATRADAEALHETALACGDAEVLEMLGDVAQPETVRDMVRQTIDRFGRVDVLVSSVGFRPRVPFLEMTAEMWQRVLDTNLSATFHLA